jgi:O-succinylbenzoate synthase
VPPAPPPSPLAPVSVGTVELVALDLPLARPWRSAAAAYATRTVLLVHVVAEEAEGWAECAVEPAPTYSPEHLGSARAVLLDHLLPMVAAGPGDVARLGPALTAVRGHEQARAAAELAVLDAQLRAAGRSLADWLGATAPGVPAGAALGLHADVGDLLAEADEALGAGAVRLRVKVAPGAAAGPLRALRDHVGPGVALQADANGTFRLEDTGHLAELEALDELGLACLEQPLPPEDLVGSARLAERLATPVCLDEPLTSIAAIEAAVALGACEVVCLKPARLGGWPAARRAHDRCVELGVPAWVGGMLETGVGRAANAAVAALPGFTLAPDLDPRGRFDPDLADPLHPVDGQVPVPRGPGTGAVPDPALLRAAEVVRLPR